MRSFHYSLNSKYTVIYITYNWIHYREVSTIFEHSYWLHNLVTLFNLGTLQFWFFFTIVTSIFQVKSTIEGCKMYIKKFRYSTILKGI